MSSAALAPRTPVAADDSSSAVEAPSRASSSGLPNVLRHRYTLLLLITLLGAALRFSYLDRPPLWLDEAYTYSRVCGTFRQMLDVLQYDGFPPLHYELYWLVGRCAKLTPHVMRAIPATESALMVPAMYFLAAGIVRRRAAMLAALFTCCSAYVLAYAHDAKMYAGAWLAVTLHVACLLWWTRTTGQLARIASLAWIASGLAMAGLHYSTLALLAIEPVILATTPAARHWRRWATFLLGALLIVAGPTGYFLGFNRLGDMVANRGFAHGTDLAWADMVNMGQTGPNLVRRTGTAFLYGWEWSTGLWASRIDPDAQHGFQIAGGFVLLALATGAVTWPKRRSAVGESVRVYVEPTPYREASHVLPYAEPSAPQVAITSIEETTEPPHQPWWRQYLWLGLWIVGLGYAWYCASMRNFAAPTDWLDAAHRFLLGREWWLVTLIVALATISHFAPVVARCLAGTLAAALVASLLIAVLTLGPARLFSGPEWYTKYWPVFSQWWDWVTDDRVLLALVVVLPVVAWQFCGDSLRARSLRAAQFILVTAALFGACHLIYKYYTFRIDHLARQAMTDEHKIPSMAAARAYVWINWNSLWITRYLGLIWPATAIAASALLMRLPTRALRYTVIALLLALNLGQATARIFAGTEFPLDRVAADVAAAQPPHAETRTVLSQITAPAIESAYAPTIYGQQGRYYLSMIAPHPVTPRQFRKAPPDAESIEQYWGIKLWPDPRPATVAAELAKSPDVRRLVVWDLDFEHKKADNDPLQSALGPAWKLVHQNYFDCRLHWSWTHLSTFRRREFVRASTAP